MQYYAARSASHAICLRSQPLPPCPATATHLRGVREHQLDELLRLLHRLLQEQLDGGGHQLQLHCRRLLGERLQELLQQLVCWEVGRVESVG